MPKIKLQFLCFVRKVRCQIVKFENKYYDKRKISETINGKRVVTFLANYPKWLGET